MLQKIKSFLAQYNITTHSIVGVWFAAIAFYYDNQVFHDYVNKTAISIYNWMPHWLEGLIIGVVLPYIAYRKGLSPTGKLFVASQSAVEQPKATAAVVNNTVELPSKPVDLHVADVAAKLTPVLLILLLMGGLVGCATKTSTTGTAPAVTNATKVAAALDDVAASLSVLQQVEISASTAMLIDPVTHKSIQKALVVVGKDGALLTTALSDSTKAATVPALVAQLTADLEIGVKSGVLGIKDTKTQTTLLALITSVEAGAQIILQYSQPGS